MLLEEGFYVFSSDPLFTWHPKTLRRHASSAIARAARRSRRAGRALHLQAFETILCRLRLASLLTRPWKPKSLSVMDFNASALGRFFMLLVVCFQRYHRGPPGGAGRCDEGRSGLARP